MDAGGAITAAPWGAMLGSAGMHGSDKYGLGSSQAFGATGIDFAPQWASASFASSMVRKSLHIATLPLY